MMRGRKRYPEAIVNLKEIRELMLLRDWTRDNLARELGLCRNTVDRWFCAKEANKRTPGVAECRLMQQWLIEARGGVRQLATA